MRIRIPLDENDIFINSGILLMNLKKFRENNLEETFFKHLKENKTWTDQDVINFVCKNNTYYLPLKFNLMPIETNQGYFNKIEEFNNVIKNPHILHFAQKPWSENEVRLSSYWDRYNNYLNEILNPITNSY